MGLPGSWSPWYRGAPLTHSESEQIEKPKNWSNKQTNPHMAIEAEVSGKMVRNFVGPGSPIFCLTESSDL